jgi:hypothetical protein
MRERPEVCVEEIDLAILQQTVRILQIRLALAYGLDFGASQSEAGLEAIRQK